MLSDDALCLAAASPSVAPADFDRMFHDGELFFVIALQMNQADQTPLGFDSV